MSQPALLTFTFSAQQLRVVMLDGEPWFVATDVCAALTVNNSRMALAKLDDDEKGVSSIDTPGGAQQMAIVNEPGLYTLVLASRKPEAKRFKRWVTHEVLPAIRKTGSYSIAKPAEPAQPLGTVADWVVRCYSQDMGRYLTTVGVSKISNAARCAIQARFGTKPAQLAHDRLGALLDLMDQLHDAAYLTWWAQMKQQADLVHAFAKSADPLTSVPRLTDVPRSDDTVTARIRRAALARRIDRELPALAG